MGLETEVENVFLLNEDFGLGGGIERAGRELTVLVRSVLVMFKLVHLSFKTEIVEFQRRPMLIQAALDYALKRPWINF